MAVTCGLQSERFREQDSYCMLYLGCWCSAGSLPTIRHQLRRLCWCRLVGWPFRCGAIVVFRLGCRSHRCPIAGAVAHSRLGRRSRGRRLAA